MLSSLHNEVPDVAVGALEAQAPVGGAMPPHDGHIAVDALQQHAGLRGDLLSGEVLTWHLYVSE